MTGMWMACSFVMLVQQTMLQKATNEWCLNNAEKGEGVCCVFSTHFFGRLYTLSGALHFSVHVTSTRRIHRGHTGKGTYWSLCCSSSFLCLPHLPPAVLAFNFTATKVQPPLSLVNGEVCELYSLFLFLLQSRDRTIPLGIVLRTLTLVG